MGFELELYRFLWIELRWLGLELELDFELKRSMAVENLIDVLLGFEFLIGDVLVVLKNEIGMDELWVDEMARLEFDFVLAEVEWFVRVSFELN